MGFLCCGNYLEKMHMAFTVLFIVLANHAVRTKQSSSVSDISMTMSDMSTMSETGSVSLPSTSGGISMTYSTESTYSSVDMSSVSGIYPSETTSYTMGGTSSASMWGSTESMPSMPQNSMTTMSPGGSTTPGDPAMMSCMSYQSSMSSDPTMMSCMSYQSYMSSDPTMMSCMSYQSSMSSDPTMMSSMSYQSSISNNPTMASCMSYQSSMSSDPTMMSCMSYQSSMSSDPTMMSCMSYQSSMSSDPPMMSSMSYQSSMSSDPPMMSSMSYQSSMSSDPPMMSSMSYQSSMSSDPPMMSSMSYQSSLSSDPSMMSSMSYQSSMSSDPPMMSSMSYQSSMSSDPPMMSSMSYQSSMSSDPPMVSSMSYQSSMSSDPQMMSSMSYQSSLSSDPPMMSSMSYQSSLSSDPTMMSSMSYQSSMSSDPTMMSSMSYQSSMSSDPLMMSSMSYQSSISSDPPMMSSMSYQSSMSSDPTMMSSISYQSSMSSDPPMMSSMSYQSSMSSDPSMMSSMSYQSSMSSNPPMMSSMSYQSSMSSDPPMMSSMSYQSSMSSDPAMMSSMSYQSSMSSDPLMMSSMSYQSSMSSDPPMMSSMSYQSSLSSDPPVMSSMSYQSSLSSDPTMMSSMSYQSSMSSDPPLMSSMSYQSSMSSDPPMMSSMSSSNMMASYSSTMISSQAMGTSTPPLSSSPPGDSSSSMIQMSSSSPGESSSSAPPLSSSPPGDSSSSMIQMSSSPPAASSSSTPPLLSSPGDSSSSMPPMSSSPPAASSSSTPPLSSSPGDSSSSMPPMSSSSPAASSSSALPLSSSSPGYSSSSMIQMSSSPPAASSSSTPPLSSSSPGDSSSSMPPMSSSSPAAGSTSTPPLSSSSPGDSSSSMIQMSSSSPAASSSSAPPLSSSSPGESSSSMIQMSSSSPAASSSSAPPLSSSSPGESSSSMPQMSSSSPAASTSSTPQVSSSSPAAGSSSTPQISSSSPADSSSSTPQVSSSSPAAGSSSTSPVSSSSATTSSSTIAPSSSEASATLTTSTEIMPSTTMTTPTSTLVDTSTSVAITPSSVSVAPSSSIVIDFSGFYGCFQQRGINFLAMYEAYNKVYCAANTITAIGDKLANLTLPDGNVTTIDLSPASSSVLATVTPAPLSTSGPNCSAYDFTGQSNAEMLSGLQNDVQTSVTFFTSQASTEVDQAAQCGVNVLGSQASTYTSTIDTYKTNAKAQNAEFKTYFEALLTALKEVTGCTGTLDCAGQCNGAALFHPKCKICYGGTANVSVISDFLDCNDECNGTATTNNCGECYGGSTSRNITYGVDSCNGQCTGKPGYVSSTDCHNECNGTAFIDSCSGQCVGGSTGQSAADFRDCNNNCNGTSVNDTCGFCVAASSASGVTGSQYKDCNNDCYTPGTLSQMASNNTCLICVGGRTGNAATEGMDACGVCNGDNSTCTDCSGVPNGGQVLDACGLCNGDGTSCLAVTSVSLDYVPAQTARTVKVGGAGLNGASLECVAINQATNAETSVTITQKTAQEVTISLPALAAATYKISCRQGSGQALANSTATVTVYASSATVTSVTPTQFTISGSTQSLAFVGSGFVVNHTYCHVKVGAAAETTFLASVTDGSNAACDVTHPASSSQILVALSLNKVDKLASDTTVTAQAAAPTATAAFTNSGEKVVVTFSAPVDTASLTSCAAVFQDVSSLGSSATCSFQSRTIMLIESTTAAIDSSLTIKTGAVKAFGETYAIAASGTITLAKGSNPLKPTGIIRGPSQLGTCSDLSVDALGSIGGGGRALTYTWAVSPSTGLTLTGQSTASLSVTGTMSGSTYTVTVTVCNFMNECDTTPTLTVQKLTTAVPDVYVTAGVDTSNVLVSEGFELTANAKLTNCVDDTLLFSWTFSDSRVNINTVDQTRTVYNVRTGDLPGDVTVTATVTVSLASDTTRTVAASISLVTKSTALVASIKGSDTVTIGTQTGQLSLDGSGSLDPDGASGSLQYEWSCVEQLASSTATCLDPTGATFPTASERTTATLTMATSRLSGGKTYVFTLTVSKSSGSSTRSNTASVTVVTIEGTPPKVLFRDLAGGNKINTNNIFTIRAIVESSTTFTTTWESVVKDGYGFVDVTDANNLQTLPTVTATTSTSSVTVLSIKAGILQRGTNYRFKITVTDANGKSSVATEDVYVYNGVTSCSISAPSSYQELDPVSLSVSKCYTDSDGIPLTYTLYQVSGGSDTSVPLSTTQDSGQFTVAVGPKADTSGKNVFAVQVCANKGGCMIYKTGDITVTAATAAALVAKQTSVISNTDTFLKEGKPLQAAVALAIYIAALQQSASRRRRSADEALDRQKRSTVVTTTLATLQINLVNTSLNTMQLKETEANTLLGVLGALPATTVSDSDMLVVTSFYVTITNYFQTNSVKMTTSSVQSIQTWTAALAARSVTGSDVTALTSKIAKAARLGYQLDESQTFTFAQSTRKYMFIIPGSGHVSKDTNSTTINFGDTLRKRFASWACSSGTCEGVGVEITTSNTDVDPYSTSSDDIKRRSSDVVDILLIDPVSGVELSSVTGLSAPVAMTFVVTRPQSGSTLSCKYWNTLSARWETDGVSISSQSSSSVTCTSDHLTGFATFGEPTTAAPSGQTGLIVGIVFGGIIAMCVIIGVAIVIALAVNKKNKVNIVEAISPPLGPEP